jgi:hypothetical protein
MRRLVIGLMILFGAGYTACVIGPKQDDPASLTATPDADVSDTGTFGPSGQDAGRSSDTGLTATPSDEAGALDGGEVATDATGDTSDADATGETSDADATDAPADAPTEGG